MVDFSILSQLSQLLNDWIPKTASIAVAHQNRYIIYQAGDHDLRISPGQAVPEGSIANRVFSNHSRVESEIDSSVFGIPYHGLGYPLRTDDGDESAVAIILPPRQTTTVEPITFIMGQVEGMWRPIPIEDVAYFESYQKKTWIHAKEGDFVTENTLLSLEERLPRSKFLRIHRSYIINIAFIDTIQRDIRSNLVITLRTRDATHLSVAQTYVRHVRESLGF